MSILAPPPRKINRPTSLRMCPWCRGTLTADGDCPPCRAVEHRETAIRARHRRQELVGRLAELIECRPDELVELLVEIAQSAGGAS